MKITPHTSSEPLAARFLARFSRLQGTAALALAVAIPLATAPARADDPPPPGPLYSLSATASERIDNDRLTATLAVQVEGDDPAVLAQRLDETMGAALAIVEPVETLQVATRDYRIAPEYDERGQRTPRWRGSQQLELQTGDIEAAAAAIGRLQQNLQVQGMRFSVAPETLAKASDRLIVEALQRFEARAALIARTLGAASHRVVDADVSTGETMGPAAAPRMSMRSADGRAHPSAPALSGGTSEVSVSVRGRIELTDE